MYILLHKVLLYLRSLCIFLKKYITDENSYLIDGNLIGSIITPDKDIIPNSKNLKPAYIVFENYEIKFNHLIPDSIFTISSLNTKKKFVLQHESFFGSTFAQAYYLKWIDFLKKVSSSSKMDGEIETSITTTRIIDNIMEKGIKK